MKIEDLDEFQGLTIEMIRAYLERDKWKRNGDWWTNGAFAECLDPNASESLAVWIKAMAAHCNLTAQALLREINPRWRLGIPSNAARKAHPGAWVGRSEGVIGSYNVMIGLWDGDEFQRGSQYAIHPTRWSFWPVDNNGSRVRWPEKNWVML